MIPLLLQMSPRPNLTISRADDTVLNFTKERTRLSSGLFAFHQIFEAPVFYFFILPPLLSSGIYLVKDGEPSDEELEYLSLELAGKWDKLGRRLGFNQAAISSYDEDKTNLEDKALNMLMGWKQEQGSKATYTVLNDALCHKLVKCKRLAEQFCCDKVEGNASS